MESPTPLKPVVVEEARLSPPVPSYTTTNVYTATWTGVPIDKTPISAQAVPRQVLEDQHCERIKDAVRNVSGVSQVKTPSQTPQPAGSSPATARR